MRDVVGRYINFLCPNTAFQHTINIIFPFINMYSSRAIDHINSFSQSDILPDFCFTRNWCCFAYSFFFHRIYHTRFPHIGIPNEPNTNIFFIPMKNVKLPE